MVQQREFFSEPDGMFTLKGLFLVDDVFSLAVHHGSNRKPCALAA